MILIIHIAVCESVMLIPQYCVEGEIYSLIIGFVAWATAVALVPIVTRRPLGGALILHCHAVDCSTKNHKNKITLIASKVSWGTSTTASTWIGDRTLWTLVRSLKWTLNCDQMHPTTTHFSGQAEGTLTSKRLSSETSHSYPRYSVWKHNVIT